MFPKKKKQLQNGYIEPDFPMSVPFPPLYFFFRSLYDVGYWMACHPSGTVLFMESDSEGSHMADDYRSNHSYSSRRGNSGNRGTSDLTSWIPILIFLFCFPPAGILLLILRLMGITGRRRGQVGRHPYDLQREAAGAQASPTQTSRPTQRQEPPPHVKRASGNDVRGGGRLLTIAGAVIAAICGMGALSAFLDALSWDGLLYSLEDIFLPLAICGGGLCMAWYGLRKGRRAKRYRQYLSLIGHRESIAVSTLAEATGFSLHKVREDLQDMLDDGIFPMGYLDLGSDRLVLNDAGIQDRPVEDPAPEAPKEVERAEAVLTEIRALNDAIEDPEMSRKIDRIGEITGNIFAYLREKPDKEGKLRSFLNYYLPTTLKILGSYAQLEAQGVEGENISAAKERIEGMMDKVVEGFEQQLDRLFQDDAMDITSDVEVLERMLEKDGLGSSGLTLGG